MGDLGPSELGSGHLRSSLPVPNPTKSFWQTSYPNDLVNHRSTSELPTQTDVVVVGSGITSVFAVRELLQSTDHTNVLVLEARTTCSGATGRNGGHLQPIIHEQRPHIIDFEVNTFKHVESLILENDIKCDFRRLNGVIGFFRKDFFDDAKEELEKSKKIDPNHAKLVQVIEDEEGLKEVRLPDAVGACKQSAAASLSPYKLVIWLWQDLLRQYGSRLNLQTNTPVTNIAESSSNMFPVVAQTDRGHIAARHVILATNAYTSHLLHEMGPMITPTQGQMSALVPPPPFDKHLLPHSYGFVGVEDMDKIESDYLVQAPVAIGAHLMYGGARALVEGGGTGVSDDSYIDLKAEQYLKELPKRLDLDSPQNSADRQLERLKELPMAACWTGIMGYSKDHFPWVGAVPDRKGVWVSAAYTGHGMPNAPGCGRHVARLVAATLSGKDWQEQEEKALADKEIPAEYVFTKKRLAGLQGVETNPHGIVE